MVLTLKAGDSKCRPPLTVNGSDRRTLATSHGNERKGRQVVFARERLMIGLTIPLFVVLVSS
jgi:hypothetical protein